MSCSPKGCGFGKSFRDDTYKDERIKGITKLLEKKLSSKVKKSHKKSPKSHKSLKKYRSKSKRSKRSKRSRGFGRRSRKRKRRSRKFGYMDLRADQIIRLVNSNKVYNNLTCD